MVVTCYDVLAVGPDATDEEIVTAFRERARETHPDVSDHADATDRFRLLARARTTLLDAKTRTRYDRLGHDAYADRAWSEEFTATWLAVTEEWVEERDAASGVEQSDTSAEDSATAESESATDRREGADDAERRDDRTGKSTAREDTTAESAPADNTAESTDTDRTATSATGHTTAAAGGTATSAATTAGADSATVSGGTGRTTADVDDAGLFDVESSWVDPSGDAGRGDSDGFAVRNVEPTSGGRRVSVGWPDETELLFAVALWIGYPFFLFGTVAPAFPLVVNATVGVLTLLLVGYALVRPAIGLGVFGAWSVVAPAVVALWNVDAGSVVLPVIVGACWLPFGFALLVAYEFG